MKYLYECHNHHQFVVDEPIPPSARCMIQMANGDPRCGMALEFIEDAEVWPPPPPPELERTTKDEAQGWYFELEKAVESHVVGNVMTVVVGVVSWLLKQQGAEVRKERKPHGPL